MNLLAHLERIGPMAKPIVQLFSVDRIDPDAPRQGPSASAVGGIMSRLTSEFSSPADAQPAERAAGAAGASPSQRAYLSRCIILQAIGAAFIAGLWITGIAGKPFETENGFLCWIIVGLAVLGIACVFLQRWRDVQWLATHVVRIGLLGTVVGLIVAFSAARNGGSSDPNEIRSMIAAVVDGMYISLYATLLGVGTNLWLKINMRLLGHIDG